MSDSGTILKHIHGLLGDKAADVVGAMLLGDEQLSVRDGGLMIRVTILPDQGRRTAATMVHAHVISSLMGHRFPAEAETLMQPIDLPACIVGIDRVRKMALFDVARVWVDLVAGPVFSLLLGKPVLDAERFEPTYDPWSDGGGGWVGPIGFRFAESAAESRIGAAPVFQDAMLLANPTPLHLAKATMDGAAGPQWRYTLEINGHAANYYDPDWQGVGEPTHGGIAIRFATFHHLSRPDWVEQRQAVDDAIVEYIQMHVDEYAAGIDESFCDHADDKELAQEITVFVRCACARILFGNSVAKWPDVYYFVRPGGELSEPRRSMSEVTFARTMGLRELLSDEANLTGLKRCAMRSSESGAINQALHNGSKMEDLRLLPLIIPVDDATPSDVDLAMQTFAEELREKKSPWWRFW